MPNESVDKENLERELTLEHRREIYLQAAATVRDEVAPDTWQVFQLAVVEKIPITKVADRLGKSVGAAYGCCGRVMNRLRRAIERIEADL